MRRLFISQKVGHLSMDLAKNDHPKGLLQIPYENPGRRVYVLEVSQVVVENCTLLQISILNLLFDVFFGAFYQRNEGLNIVGR